MDFSKVILTVPLSMLKREKIKFNPKLPEDKSLAISHLGAGCIEKVSNVFITNPNPGSKHYGSTVIDLGKVKKKLRN